VVPRTAVFALCLFANCGLADIVINELMYHPYEPYPYPYYTNNTEYVEILNTGATNVDLTDYRFDNGVDFDFPDGKIVGPNQYLLICENLHQFTNAYPAVTNLVGQFSGNLNNGGERVTLSRLENGEWVTVDTIKYIDGGPADGLNRSLELVNPGFAHLRDEYYGTWMSSLTVSGTPGIANSRYDAEPPPVVGNVDHDPPLPLPGSSVAITAHAAGFNGEKLNSVVLNYRIDANPANAWRQVPMMDHGKSGDAVAGDGVYTVYLPEANDPPMTNGSSYEFTITATDTLTREITVPATNTADVPGPGPFSYLCGFLNDEDYTGEYSTFHILMTRANRHLLEYGRDKRSKVPIDCTFITSDGEIFYNAGTRYRGNGSLKWPFNFRIEIPRGRDLDGSREWNLNYKMAMLQHLGTKVIDSAGYGCHGLNTELCRVWLNETDKTKAYEQTPGECQDIYVKLEPVDNDLLSRYYSGLIGNSYRGQNGSNAGLKVGTIPNYQSWYFATINNPLTGWTELDDLCKLLANDVSLYPTILTNLVDVRQWGRLYGCQSAMSNGEGGFHSPRRTQGDDHFVHRRADTGLFVLYPWDLDEVIEHGVEGQVDANRSIWAYNNGGPAAAVVTKFLFNPPIVSYYVGDVLDIVENVMSPANMAPILDDMGSIMTPAYRQKITSSIAMRLNKIRSEVNTNLTFDITGAVVEANGISIVNSSSIALTGTAPMNYTTAVLVNGAADTTWSTRNNAWSTTANVLLPAARGMLDIAAVGADGNRLKSVQQIVINKADNETHSGTVTANTTWDNPGGVLTVSGNVTIDNGATLTIAAGNTVLMAPGKQLLANNGTLKLAGDAADNVHILPSDAASAWSIVAEGSGTVTGQYARLTGGRVECNGGDVVLVESELESYAGGAGIVDVNTGNALIHRCAVSDYALMDFSSAQVTISECLLRGMGSHGARFSGGAGTVSRTTMEDGDAGATGIQATGGAVVNAADCLFKGIPGSALLVDNTSSGSLGNGLVRDCGTALEVAAGATSSNRHVTAANCAEGVAGTSASLHSAILWETAANFPLGTPTVSFSDVTAPGTNAPAGEGNINRPPWFRDSVNGDYRLQPISPCIGAGHGGSDMGATFPVGANPATPSTLTASNTCVSGTNAVELTWTDAGDDETWFDIERSVSGDSDWLLVASMPADTTSYTDTSVGQNTIYDYRVRARHARGVSFLADPATVSTAIGDAGESLRITEIMFHPKDGSTADADDYEFLEVSNLGSSPLDLSGFTINGIGNYTFPTGTVLQAGTNFVLIGHAGAFAERYPGTPYFGLYTGSLRNGGERLRIYDNKGGTVLDFTYNDWYPSTEGDGDSLVLVGPDGDLDSAASWRPSGTMYGTPGTQETLQPYAQVVIGEVFSHTDEPFEDAIELYNAGTAAVDIANWYLSDDDSDLTKYQIPGSTPEIPVGGYHVFYASTSFGQGANEFGLSELGDNVYLSSGDGAQITDYRTSEKFGASANGVSIGRYVRSDGEVDFVAMSSQTFGVSAPNSSAEFRTGGGASNSYPLVGPVVISEIMYNPAAAGKEFVEILNIASTNVPLFSGTNCWEFDGAMEYVFPTNTWIAPGEHIVITSIDPELFRDAMGLTNATLTILGPFDGDLANDGESVKLYRPGALETNGFVPRIRVDRVKYDDDLPWPEAADNDGPSLERVSPPSYGNDPANWIAATVGGTPGESNNTAGVPSVAFAPPASSGLETNGTVTLTIALMPASASTVTVSYAVSGGTASNGSDYAFTPGSVVFWPYETSKTVSLQILNDSDPEIDETVDIQLTALSANARYGGARIHRHTIVDTDATALTAPAIDPAGESSFTFSTKVSMSNPEPDAEVYYTLDGTTPTTDDYLYSSPFVLNSTAKVKARVFLGSVNASPVTTALFLQQSPPPTVGIIEKRIASGENDATELNSGTPNVGDTQLQLGFFFRKPYVATGLRFTGVAIPAGGVSISNAYIQFTAAGAGYGDGGQLDIYGEDVDSSVEFADTSENITGRVRTTASVSWPTSPQGDWPPGNAGPAQRTPDISAVIQEIVDRPGWQPTNALSIIIISPAVNVYRNAYSVESDADKAALLHVEYGVKESGDGDRDGMLDVWEIQHFGSTNAQDGGPQEDYDLDGMVNVDEYIAGTIPTNDQSVFEISAAASAASGRYMLYWSSVAGRLYAVYRATNLLQDWQAAEPLAGNLPADPSGTNSYDDTTATNSPAFYRIGVQLDE